MKVGVIQSNYIPWKGYLDFIDDCDLFVLLDDVQYTRRDWRNRNIICTPYGEKWLTIPLWNKGRRDWNICDMWTSGDEWAESHYGSLKQAYGKSPFWDEFPIKELYEQAPNNLSEINRRFLERICLWLGITTPLANSVGLATEGEKTDKLIAICEAVGATTYLSGPSARGYLDVRLLESAGIAVEWKRYEYEPYEGMETHHCSVLDMLYKAGADRRYWKCLRP